MGRPHWGWGCFSPRPPGPPPAVRGLWPQARTHLCSTGNQRQAWPAMPFGAPGVIPRVSIWGPGGWVERRGLGGRSPGFPELGSRTFLRGSHHSCCNWNWRGTDGPKKGLSCEFHPVLGQAGLCPKGSRLWPEALARGCATLPPNLPPPPHPHFPHGLHDLVSVGGQLRPPGALGGFDLPAALRGRHFQKVLLPFIFPQGNKHP